VTVARSAPLPSLPWDRCAARIMPTTGRPLRGATIGCADVPAGVPVASAAPTSSAAQPPHGLARESGDDGLSDRFAALVRNAQACRRCPRMEGRTRAIGPANGPLDAEILFVAEAPGRLGADRTGVPLSGDRTGRNFDALLASAGIDRSRVFVTNAALCNPRRPDGLNDRPRAAELRNCADHLRALIDLLDPPWVVSLGRAALDALALIEPHDCVLARDVGTAARWYGRRLAPLYHPGPRAVARRALEQHVADYAALAALLGADITMRKRRRDR
jgi:uracil-DNA glycosylase